MNNKPTISAAFRTFNAGDLFDDVLASLDGLADEIIVVDSGSTDKTVEIAEKHNAVIIKEAWRGFIAQANYSFEFCTKDWILLMDQDEIVTTDLKTKIIKELENPKYDGYEVNRQTIYLGKRMNYVWYPDWIFRLGRKDKNARCIGDEPHEVMTVDGTIGRIDAALDHYSHKDFADHLNKMTSYAKLGAISYHQRGKKATATKLILNPLWGFVKAYIFRLGFLDGKRGFIASFSTAVTVYLKYSMLYELELKDKQ